MGALQAPRAIEPPAKVLQWPGQMAQLESGHLVMDRTAAHALKIKLMWIERSPQEVYQLQLDAFAKAAEANRQASLAAQRLEFESERNRLPLGRRLKIGLAVAASIAAALAGGYVVGSVQER